MRHFFFFVKLKFVNLKFTKLKLKTQSDCFKLEFDKLKFQKNAT